MMMYINGRFTYLLRTLAPIEDLFACTRTKAEYTTETDQNAAASGGSKHFGDSLYIPASPWSV